jgi:hypothetical protein
LLLIIFSTINSFAQDQSPALGWDLTYRSVFNAANVPENDAVARYFKDSESGKIPEMFPAEFVKIIDDGDIDEAIFLDHQAFYRSGHRVSSLQFKIHDKVLIQTYASEGGYNPAQDFSLDAFNKQLEGLWQWRQSIPVSHSKLKPPEGYIYSGYVGVLSLYRNGESKQALLTDDDFIEVSEDDGKGDIKAGKLYRFMDYLSLVGGNYEEFEAIDATRHSKSEAKSIEEKQKGASAEVGIDKCLAELEVDKKNLLLLFTASWAEKDTETLRPIVKQILKGRKLSIVEIDYDQNIDAVEKCGVITVPAIFAIKDGLKQGVYVGSPTTQEFSRYLDSIY